MNPRRALAAVNSGARKCERAMAHLYLRRLQASDATECGLDFGTAELNATCCDGLLDVPAPPISATFNTVVLVILSGLFSGLNLGLMSFTDDDLGIIIDGSSDEREAVRGSGRSQAVTCCCARCCSATRS